MENPAKRPLQLGSVQPSQEESRSPAFPAEVCKHLSIHKPFARESSCDPASQSSPGRWGLQEPPVPTPHGLCVTSSSSGNIRWGGGWRLQVWGKSKQGRHHVEPLEMQILGPHPTLPNQHMGGGPVRCLQDVAVPGCQQFIPRRCASPSKSPHKETPDVIGRQGVQSLAGLRRPLGCDSQSLDRRWSPHPCCSGTSVLGAAASESASSRTPESLLDTTRSKQRTPRRNLRLQGWRRPRHPSTPPAGTRGQLPLLGATPIAHRTLPSEPSLGARDWTIFGVPRFWRHWRPV